MILYEVRKFQYSVGLTTEAKQTWQAADNLCATISRITSQSIVYSVVRCFFFVLQAPVSLLHIPQWQERRVQVFVIHCPASHVL